MKEKKKIGSPRIVSPPAQDMIKIGEEMIKWLKANPGVVHLSQWYTIEKRFTYNQWKTFIQKHEFIPYYEVALKIIGVKYLDSTINPSIAQRWLRVYFKDLKEQEDEDLKAKIELEAKQKTDVPPLSNQIDIENEMMLLRAENAKLKSQIEQNAKD